MACTQLGASVIVCGPAAVYRRYYGQCEVCQRRRRMVRRYDGYYRGYTEGCCHCGTFWVDGMESEKDVDRASKWWYEAIPPREFDADIRRHEKAYLD